MFFDRCYKIKLITVQIRKSAHISHTSRLQLCQRCIGLQKEDCEIDLIMFQSSPLECSVRVSPSTERFPDVEVIQPVAYYESRCSKLARAMESLWPIFTLFTKINIIMDGEAVKRSCKSVCKRLKLELYENKQKASLLTGKLNMQATDLCKTALYDCTENTCVN